MRVIVDATDYAGIAAACLNQIRQFGCASVAVTIRLLDMLERVANEVRSADHRAVLEKHARAIRDDGIAQAANEGDRAAIETRFAAAEKACRVGPRQSGADEDGAR